jgi:DNA repair protein SbcD/Mre11
MRILHTSDWHLGRSLHRSDLSAAQEAFLDHLVDTVKSEEIDAVLVAGDVYDRAVPPVDAVRLCEDALVRLRDAGAQVILISGNHDSARRLGFGSPLFDRAGVYLRTRPDGLAAPVMLADDHGEVAVYGIPYLEPAAYAAAETGATAEAAPEPAPEPEAAREAEPVRRTHRAVLGDAVSRIKADAARRGAARTVLMAHGWVAGGQPSESERDISVGGIGQVPVSVFDGFSYVALGHLHGQQTLAEHLRYSGSPLPYSFSEATHRKGSWLVELDAAGLARAQRVPSPPHRRLSLVRGRLDELLTSREYDAYADDFLSVTLTDTARPEAAMDRLRARFPHTLVLDFKPEGVAEDNRSYGARVAGRDDLTIAAEFVQHVRNTPLTTGEQALLASAFEAVRIGEAG